MNEAVGHVILKVCPLYTTTEAKYVLMMMLLCEEYDASYHKIGASCGMEISEVADAANMLKVIGANVSRDFNRVVISDKFKPSTRVEVQSEETRLLQSVQDGIGDTVRSGDSETQGEQGTIESYIRDGGKYPSPSQGKHA